MKIMAQSFEMGAQDSYIRLGKDEIQYYFAPFAVCVDND